MPRLAILAVVGPLVCAGCFTAQQPFDPYRARAQAARLDGSLANPSPHEAVEADLGALMHALDAFWLAVADRTRVTTGERPLETPAPATWACDTCAVARAGSSGHPSGAPEGPCARCGGTTAERLSPIATPAAIGRYPSYEEGLQVLLPILAGGSPAPDLLDPWGRVYRYLPEADAQIGDPGIPRGGFLVYSVGPNGIDEAGDGDDISNLPPVSPTHAPPGDRWGEAHLAPPRRR